MKAQIGSCTSFAVALVLFLAAAIPSQATQRRDPFGPQEVASTADSTRAKTHTNAKKTVNPPPEAKGKKQPMGSSAASARNSADSKNHSGRGTGMK